MTPSEFIELSKNMVIAYFNSHIGYWYGSAPRKEREICIYDVVVTDFTMKNDLVMTVKLNVVDDYSVDYFVEYDPNKEDRIQSRIVEREDEYECDIRPIFR